MTHPTICNSIEAAERTYLEQVETKLGGALESIDVRVRRYAETFKSRSISGETGRRRIMPKKFHAGNRARHFRKELCAREGQKSAVCRLRVQCTNWAWLLPVTRQFSFRNRRARWTNLKTAGCKIYERIIDKNNRFCFAAFSIESNGRQWRVLLMELIIFINKTIEESMWAIQMYGISTWSF